MTKKNTLFFLSIVVVLSAPYAYAKENSCLKTYQSTQTLSLLAKVQSSLKNNPHSFPTLLIGDQIREHIDGVVQNFHELIRKFQKEGVENQVEFNLNNAETLLKRFSKTAEQTEALLEKGGSRTEKLLELETSLRECFGHLKTCDSNIRLTLANIKKDLIQAENLIASIHKDSTEIRNLIESDVLLNQVPSQLKASVVDSISAHLENLDLIQSKIKAAILTQQHQLILLESVGSSDISRAYATLARLEILGARDLRALDLKQYEKIQSATGKQQLEAMTEHPFERLTKDLPRSVLGDQMMQKIERKELTSVFDILGFLIHLRKNKDGTPLFLNLTDIKLITEAFQSESGSSEQRVWVNFYKNPTNFKSSFNMPTVASMATKETTEHRFPAPEAGNYIYRHVPQVTLPWLLLFLESIPLAEARDYLNWLGQKYKAARNLEIESKVGNESAQLPELKNKLLKTSFFKRLTPENRQLKRTIEAIESRESIHYYSLSTIRLKYDQINAEMAEFQTLLNGIEPLQGSDTLITITVPKSKFGSVDRFTFAVPVN